MAKTSMELAAQAQNTPDIVRFDAFEAGRIELPSDEFVTEAQMARQGNDLTLTAPGGQTIVIEGYFAADPAPLLIGPDGSVLTQALVDSFARSPNGYAAADTASDESPVGAVEEIKGEATVTRADGSVEKLSIGTPIYQGDIVETAADGAVNITFIDETSMAVSENARLAIDNYTFDPATESGTTNFSVLRGLFVFTSGLIGRDDPDDVKIETPVGSIGIRGTIIAGEILPGGESKISVLEGAIVVSNGAGQQTLSQQFETVKLGGFDQPMEAMGVVPAQDIGSRFGSVGSVLPSLFTVIQDTGGEQSRAAPAATPAQAASENPVQDSAPASANTASSNTPDAGPQPAQAAIDGIINLNGNSNSLPTPETISGQSAAVPGAIPNMAPSPIAISVSASSLPPTQTAPAMTNVATPDPSQSLTQPPPPAVISAGANNTGTNTPSAPSITFAQSGPLSDIAAAGTAIGTFTTGIAGTTYNVTSTSLNPSYFSAVNTGSGLNITLTAAGAAYLAGSLDSLALGTITVQATLPDATVITNSFTPAVTDANQGSTYSAEVWSNVTMLTDGIDNNAGFTVTALGDINNDGFADFAFSNNTNAAGQNHSYMVYGGASRLPDGPITSLGGLSVRPNASGGDDHSESRIAGIGDFNGDGIEDYVIGQGNNFSTSGSGAVTIVSGANPSDHTQIGALPTSGMAGSSVTGVGDVDNDGYADFVFGMPGVEQARLMLGNGAAWGANGTQSVTLTTPGFPTFGTEIQGIGDFDGDGYSDFAVSAPNAGAGQTGMVWLYSGLQAAATGTTSTILYGTQTNEMFGREIVSLGDIDGDGLSDMMIGGDGNQARLYLGGDTVQDGTFDSGPDYTLTGAAGIGDFNGDGYDDFAVSVADDTQTRTYVVFGRDGFTGDMNLSFLKNPDNALEIRYGGADKNHDIEISGLGDINGDGYDDFAMGVPDANGAAAGNGGLMVVYGNSDAPRQLNATADHQALVGGPDANPLSDQGYSNISMRSGAGNDTLKITSTDFLGLHGGAGVDTIEAYGNLDFSQIDFEKMSGVEKLNYTSANQTITLTLENLFNLLKTSDSGEFVLNSTMTGSVLNLEGAGFVETGASATDVTDALNATGHGAASDTTSNAGYNAFHIGGYTLLIDTDVTVNVAA